MIRLGLRLTVSGGREAIARLVLIAIGVAIGAALLISTIAALHAVNSQNTRYAWLETGHAEPAPAKKSADPIWWAEAADYYQGQLIGRVDVAANGPNSPLPPGVTTLPKAGDYYASPAMAKLLRSKPANQLAARYPGHLAGTIGAAGLPSPDSLIILIGRPGAELSKQHDVIQISQISTTTPNNCPGCPIEVGIDANGITLILSVVIAALLFPVLIFVASSTRLSAARREQRFAAMRLIGATPKQIGVISSVEAIVAALAGAGLGFGLFFAFRPLLARIPFTGETFYTGDLSVGPVAVLVILLGIPLAAAFSARIALRRVSLSPLGVARRVTPPHPRAWRLSPLVLAFAELIYLAYFSDIGGSGPGTNTSEQAAVYVLGIVGVMLGLVVAGPWLTMIGARLVARWANRPGALIAARRLADNPGVAFRAISGLTIALFVGTAAVGIITTIVAYNSGRAGQTAVTKGLVVDEFRFGPHAIPTSIPVSARDELTGIPGVSAVVAVRREGGDGPSEQTLAACADLAQAPVMGRCPAGAQVVSINVLPGSGFVNSGRSTAQTVWPAASVSITALQALPLDSVVVSTDGSEVAVERARTIVDTTFADTFAPQTEAEREQNRDVEGYQQLANVVILTSLPIAGAGLAVSLAGGLTERKRPFSLLRLTGAPIRLLRRVVTLEAAVPLLASAVLASGAGLLAAFLFLRAQLNETLQPPGFSYYAIVVLGLAASLAVIVSTLPLLKRITGPETARNE